MLCKYSKENSLPSSWPPNANSSTNWGNTRADWLWIFINDRAGRDNLPSCLLIASFEPPSMATGVTRPPSHFPTSLYQLRTKLEGETTMALSISGLASGLWRSRVHIRVMHCRVFPRPISSAMMQPNDPEIRLPVTHSHRNFTPSLK